MRAVVVLSVASLWVLGCADEEAPSFELNARRVAELASATCSCSDSVSKDTCAASYQEQLQASLVAQVEAGRVSVDGTRWADCLAELNGCDPTPSACDAVFKGTRAEGASCFDDSECAAGLHCEPASADAGVECATVGECVETEKIARGDRCQPMDVCEERNDVCGVATSGDDEGEHVCRTRLDKGDACPVEDYGLDALSLCKRGTGCLPDGDEIVCAVPAEEGEPCSFMVDDQRQQGPCKSGLFCNGVSGVCERFAFPEGEDVGGECDTRADCLPGLVCLADECARPLPNGSECDDDDQCVAFCVDGHCAPGFVACDVP